MDSITDSENLEKVLRLLREMIEPDLRCSTLHHPFHTPKTRYSPIYLAYSEISHFVHLQWLNLPLQPIRNVRLI